MQPAHPEDSSYALAAETLANRDFEVLPNAERPLTRETLAAADVLVIAHPSDPKWEATTNARAPRLSDRELDAIEEFVRGGGGLIALGETEQEKYGNNLNDLLARFGIEVANCTVQDYEHHLSAPSWVLAELDERRRRRARERSTSSPASHQACFYRAGTLALHNGGRVIARSSPTASPPQAPLAAITEHGAGRVVVLADSDLFGDDCIGELDNESLWLNLVYWAAQPAFAGVQTVDRLAGPLRPALGGAQGRGRGAAPDPGARRLGRPVRARRRPPHRARRDDLGRRPAPGAPLPPPAGLHRRPARRPARLGRLRLRQARLRPLPGGVPPGARPPRRDRAPRRVPDVQAERLARHLLRGADRARPLAGLRRRAGALRLRQPEVRPGQLRRLHRRLRLRVRGPVPRDLLHRRAAAEPLRRHLLRPRGGALPPRLRPGRRAPAAQPAARRRLPA